MSTSFLFLYEADLDWAFLADLAEPLTLVPFLAADFCDLIELWALLDFAEG